MCVAPFHMDSQTASSPEHLHLCLPQQNTSPATHGFLQPTGAVPLRYWRNGRFQSRRAVLLPLSSPPTPSKSMRRRPIMPPPALAAQRRMLMLLHAECHGHTPPCRFHLVVAAPTRAPTTAALLMLPSASALPLLRPYHADHSASPGPATRILAACLLLQNRSSRCGASDVC